MVDIFLVAATTIAAVTLHPSGRCGGSIRGGYIAAARKNGAVHRRFSRVIFAAAAGVGVDHHSHYYDHHHCCCRAIDACNRTQSLIHSTSQNLKGVVVIACVTSSISSTYRITISLLLALLRKGSRLEVTRRRDVSPMLIALLSSSSSSSRSSSSVAACCLSTSLESSRRLYLLRGFQDSTI